jgi:hypothetical protein
VGKKAVIVLSKPRSRAPYDLRLDIPGLRGRFDAEAVAVGKAGEGRLLDRAATLSPGDAEIIIRRRKWCRLGAMRLVRASRSRLSVKRTGLSAESDRVVAVWAAARTARWLVAGVPRAIAAEPRLVTPNPPLVFRSDATG